MRVIDILTISSNGRYVTFTSDATKLVGGDTNGVDDIFVHDLPAGTTERVSKNSSGTQANTRLGYGSRNPTISADGRYVAFHSDATNLVAGDTNGSRDVFVRDLQAQTTERVSMNSCGTQAKRSQLPPLHQLRRTLRGL